MEHTLQRTISWRLIHLIAVILIGVSAVRGVLAHNGSVILRLTPPPDPAQAVAGDRFNENRIGLDHLSLSVASLADLEAARALFDLKGVSHSEINPLTAFGIVVPVFRDPDNIQVELTAPLAA